MKLKANIDDQQETCRLIPCQNHPQAVQGGPALRFVSTTRPETSFDCRLVSHARCIHSQDFLNFSLNSIQFDINVDNLQYHFPRVQVSHGKTMAFPCCLVMTTGSQARLLTIFLFFLTPFSVSEGAACSRCARCKASEIPGIPRFVVENGKWIISGWWFQT